ncbi:MAG TPA: cation transporter, partial [Ottowia sp.]|nr:cation transporter [Ottowia sp.]
MSSSTAHPHVHPHRHAHDHAHEHGHDHPHADHDCGGAACEVAARPIDFSALAAGGALLLRIPDMDCASEEAQIRRALEGQAAVRGLRFDLGARTLAVDAPDSAWSAVEQAIAAAGLKTERLSQPTSAADTRRRQRRQATQLAAALLLALGAELLHFVAPDTRPWQFASMALAALAIALSGFGVYRKGLAALARGQLGISALMTVAVTGAFLIGQWPE